MKKWLSVGLWILAASEGVSSAETPSYQRDLLPLLQEYCWDCHGDGARKGGLNLDSYQTSEDLLRDRKVWEGIMYNLEQSLMPPANRDQPSPEERAQMVKWIDDTVFPVDPHNPDPGRVTARRLNKTEYNNTIRDLIGLDLRPADAFPDDDSGYGFDNIGDVLTMPPVLVERYLQAAQRVLNIAIFSPTAVPEQETLEIRAFRGGGTHDGNTYSMATVGEAVASFNFPVEADYLIRVKAWADRGGDELAKLIFRFAGKEVQTFEVSGSADQPQTCEVRVRATQGRQSFSITFPNDYYEPNNGDRNLYFQNVTIIGPLWGPGVPVPESHRRVFTHEPGTEGTPEATRRVLTSFVGRAYRRPAREEEIDKLAGLVQNVQESGLTWEEAMKTGLAAVLVSPYFLYRLEEETSAFASARIVDIDEFALASRLSYFLWSSMPDDRLFELAREGRLRAELAAEIKRMIADPKAEALARNFGGQWLELRNLELIQPNREIFRQFDWQLRQAMRKETETFFYRLLVENGSILDFLGADYTYVNERLAKFYGIEGVTGEEFRKVPLDHRRRGVLTHASILTITSEPSRTSPVKRGKWVLDNLLGTPPPPPPPDVPSLDSRRNRAVKGTLRQRLEAHRENAACANCHAMLDPIGFGLENFDAIGGWRDQDGDAPVDSTGRLTTGEEFHNAAELAEVLMRHKRDQFTRALATKLLTFALGRGVEFYDKLALNEIVSKTTSANYSFHALIQAICESVPFQNRRGPGWN